MEVSDPGTYADVMKQNQTVDRGALLWRQCYFVSGHIPRVADLGLWRTNGKKKKNYWYAVYLDKMVSTRAIFYGVHVTFCDFTRTNALTGIRVAVRLSARASLISLVQRTGPQQG